MLSFRIHWKSHVPPLEHYQEDNHRFSRDVALHENEFLDRNAFVNIPHADTPFGIPFDKSFVDRPGKLVPNVQDDRDVGPPTSDNELIAPRRLRLLMPSSIVQ